MSSIGGANARQDFDVAEQQAAEQARQAAEAAAAAEAQAQAAAQAAQAQQGSPDIADFARNLFQNLVNDVQTKGLEQALQDALGSIQGKLQEIQQNVGQDVGQIREGTRGISREPGQTETTEKRDDQGRLTSRESNRTVTRETGDRQTNYQTTSKDTYDRKSTSTRGFSDGKGTFERSGSYAERHERGASLSSQPKGGQSASQIGDAARASVSGGRELWKTDGRVSADATAWSSKGEGKVEGRYGTLTGDYEVNVLQAHAEAGGDISLTSRGLHARGDARAEVNIIDARGHVGYTTPSATVAGVPFNGQVDANVRARVSAEAHANGELIVDPLGGRVYAGGEIGASAVAKIEGNVTGALQYTNAAGERRSIGSITASAYASAGAEAQAHAHIGFDRGRISFDLGAGAAWGLGAGAGISGEIDVRELGNAALQGVDNLTGGAVTRARETIDDARSVVSTLTGGASERVIDSVVDRAKSVISGWFD